MLDQFQVRDLPLFDVVLALETTSLKDVVAALEPSDCRAVLVLDSGARSSMRSSRGARGSSETLRCAQHDEEFPEAHRGSRDAPVRVAR